MPAREYRLDTGFTTGPMMSADAPRQGEQLPTGGGWSPQSMIDSLTLLAAPANIGQAVNMYNRNQELFHSAFRLENDMLNAWDLMTRPIYQADPNFDVKAQLKQDGLWDDYRDNFLGVQSGAEYADKVSRIRQEERDQMIVMSNGPLGILAAVAAGSVSPTVLLPFIGEARGWWATAKGAGWGLVGGLSQELPLQLAQETRSLDDSAFSVTASTVLGGVLGGAAAYLSRPLDEMANELGGHVSLGDRRPSASRPASGGAAALIKDARLRNFDGNIVSKIMDVAGDTGPFGRFLGSPVVQNLTMDSPLIRYRTAQLSNAGLDVEGTPVGGTIEHRVKMYDGPLAESVRKLDELYSNYFFEGNGPKYGANILANVGGMLPGGTRMSKAEFKAQVAVAMENGDQHPIPEVAQAAQFARKKLFDPILSKAEEVALFKRLKRNEETGEVEVTGDITYLTRQYAQEAVARRANSFVKIVGGHIEGKLQAQFQEQLAKVVAKQAKDATLIRDLKRPYDEIANLTKQFKDELQKMYEGGRLAEDEDFNDLLTGLRDEIRNPKTPKERVKEAKKELAEAEKAAAEDPEVAARAARKKEINTRLRNLSKAAANYAKKQDGKLERIERSEQLQINTIARTSSRLQKFLLTMDSLADEVFEAELTDLNKQLTKTIKQMQRLEERALKAADGSDFAAPQDFPALDERMVSALDRRDAIELELDRIGSADRDMLRGLVQQDMDDLLKQAQQLNARRAVRADRLKQQALALNPEIVNKRIAELEQSIPDRAAAFRENWRARGLDTVPSVPGERADFTAISRQLANQVKDKILGTNARLPGMDIIYEAKGPELARLLDIPAHLLVDADGTSFLERDVEKLWHSYVRTMAPDIEVARQFGEMDVETGRPIAFTEITEEEAEVTAKYEAELDEAFAKKYENPTPEQIEKHQRDKDKKIGDLAHQYTVGRRNLEGMLSRLRGTWGIPRDPGSFATRAGRTVMNLNVLRFMGGVAISSIPDIAQPIMRYGMGKVFRDGWLPMVTNFKNFKATHRELQLAGAALDVVLHSRASQIFDIGDYMVRGSKFEKAVDYASSRMGLLAAFDYWTAAMKQVSGSTAIASTLDDVVTVVEGGKDVAGATQRLARYGIDGGTAAAIHREVTTGGGNKVDGLWWPNTESWKDQAAVEAFRTALVAQVNDTIITPGLERPLWTDASLPMRMLSQFKSFSFASTTKTTLANLQKRDMATVQGVTISLALGALSYYIYATLAGGETKAKLDTALANIDGRLDPENPGWQVFVDEALARSGVQGSLGLVQDALSQVPVTAPYVTFSGQRTSRRGGQGVTEALLGPSFDMLTEVAGAATAPRYGEPYMGVTQSSIQQASNILPLQNHFALRWAFDQIGQAAGDMFGVPERRQ